MYIVRTCTYNVLPLHTQTDNIMSKIFSVASTKGGVSKTSTGIFLASALAINKRKKILYCDTDSQTSAYEYRQWERDMYADVKEPYRIDKITPQNLLKEIDQYARLYDIIFIDIPRFTKGRDDKTMIALLAACDGILIPIKSGELDMMSTKDFIEIIRKIEQYRIDKGKGYHYAAFLTMTGRRPTNDSYAREFVQDMGVPVLKNELKDVREFDTPYTYESLLNKSKRHKERFAPFFKEVTAFFHF